MLVCTFYSPLVLIRVYSCLVAKEPLHFIFREAFFTIPFELCQWNTYYFSSEFPDDNDSMILANSPLSLELHQIDWISKVLTYTSTRVTQNLEVDGAAKIKENIALNRPKS